MVLMVAGIRSEKCMVSKAEFINALKVTFSSMLSATIEPKKLNASPTITNNGTSRVVASTRVATTNPSGLVPETSIASICSETFMAPISAAMPELIFPEHSNPVITGPTSLTKATAMRPGRSEVAPKSTRMGRICMVSTSPMIKPVMLMSGRVL